MAKTLTKDMVEALLALDDRPSERVATPEWGKVCDEVIVRGISAAERDALELDIFDLEKDKRERMKNLRARLSAMSVVDEAGERLFTDAQMEALGRKSAKALARVFNVAQRLSGLSASDIEELTKK